MNVKKKHTKNLEAVQARISVLSYEIAQRKMELQELANHLADFELSINVDINGLKNDHGIAANGWVI